jgi:adenylate cyclase
LGDAVNVASRLERLTRETGTSLVVSDDLIGAVHGCGVEPSELIGDLRRDETRIVRGRREPVTIWCASRRDGSGDYSGCRGAETGQNLRREPSNFH